MIESIALPGHTIALRRPLQARRTPQERYEPNIFKEVDSLSLLIGNNGSGKTFMLSRVIEAMRGKMLAATEVRIATAPQQEDPDWIPVPEYGVVYYTPVPHRRTHRARKRFIDASPKANYSPTYAETFELKDVIDELGISAKLEGGAAFVPETIVKLIAAALVTDGLTLPRHWNPERLAGLYRLGEEELEKPHAASGASSRASATDKPVLNIPKTYGSLLDVLLEEHEAEKIFAVFAALYSSLDAARKPQLLLGMVLHLAFGFDVPRRLPAEIMNDNAAGRVYGLADRLQNFFRVHPPELDLAKGACRFGTADKEMANDIMGMKLDKVVTLHWRDMSSGVWALLTQIAAIRGALEKLRRNGARRALVLIDEGDSFLHLEWQRQYIYNICRMLSIFKEKFDYQCLQVIVATHSPLLMTDVPRHYVTRLNMEHGASDPAGEAVQVSFAAPMQSVLNSSFAAGTIGELASRTIRDAVMQLKQGALPADAGYVGSIIDDPIIRREYELLLQEAGGASA